MTALCAPHDDPRSYAVHHSNLKRMGLSPSHYLASLTAPREQTRGMRVGTLVHAIVLGGKYTRYVGGDRRGKAWDEFAKAHAGEFIVTDSEWADAAPCAEAVLKSRVAAPWLKGRHEVPLEWTVGGRKCATRGIDILGEAHIGELKTTHVAAPSRFIWEAARMAYHAQLAWYLDGHMADLVSRPEVFERRLPSPSQLMIVAVETAPPYPVVVFRLKPSAIEEGAKMNALWMSRLAVCEESNEWPSYAQDVVDWDIDERVELEFDAD